MFTAPTNFPGTTIDVQCPMHGSPDSALHELNPGYLRVATRFFAAIEGVKTTKQLSERIYLKRTWKGDDVVQIKTKLRDEAGNQTDEWSDWQETSSSCTELHVRDHKGDVVAAVFTLAGRVCSPRMVILAQVGGDCINLGDGLQFWTYDRDGVPMAGGNLLDADQCEQFNALRKLCLDYTQE